MEIEKESRILAAAKTVFLRHGFRRVTMQDIADEAGISRPALYLKYSNKEQVFLAVVNDVATKNLAFIRGDLWAHPTTESKLHFAFEVWTVDPFRMMIESPNAKDLIDCTHGFAREIMEKFSAEFEAILVEILSPAVKAPITSLAGDGELLAPEIAHLLATSIHGFKESARTTKELRSMIYGLITLTIAALRKPSFEAAKA